MATRLPSRPVLPRGAFGASLALHGALAVAAVLPALWQAPLRPSAPGGVEVSWAAPAASATGADAEPLPVQGPAAPPAVLDAPEPEATPLPPASPERLAALLPPPPVAAAAPDASEPLPPPEPAEAAEPALLPPPPDVMPQTRRAEAPPESAAAPPPFQAAAPEPVPPPPAPVPPARRAEAPPPARAPAPPRPAPSVTRLGSGPAGSAAALAMPGPPAPAAPPTSAPPGPVLVTTPRYRQPPTPPAYPPRAVEFGLTGTVLVRARVAPDGATEETRVWRSSGHALLDAAAVAAVRRWAFEPASVDGRRVEAWVEVPVHFRLN
jgi:protein TonB